MLIYTCVCKDLCRTLSLLTSLTLMTKQIPITFCFPNALSNKFLVQMNGKIPLKKGCFPFLTHHKCLTTMIIEWLGFELVYINQKHIPGFSISTTAAQLNSPFGFTIGGHGLAVAFLCYQVKHMMAGTFGKRTCLLSNLIQKSYNSSEFLMLLGYSAGNTGFMIT